MHIFEESTFEVLIIIQGNENKFLSKNGFEKRQMRVKFQTYIEPKKKQIQEEPKTLLKNQKDKSNDRALYFSVE